MLRQTSGKSKRDARIRGRDHRVRRRCCYCGVRLHRAITGARLAAQQYSQHPLPHCPAVGFYGLRRAGLVTGRYKKADVDAPWLIEHSWLCFDERGREVTAVELADHSTTNQ